MENARIEVETLLDQRVYHTIRPRGLAGAPPIEPHAAGCTSRTVYATRPRACSYVLLYLLCDKDEPWRVIHRPGGHLAGARGRRACGRRRPTSPFRMASSAEPSGRVLLYYGSSDTRLHVAETTTQRLLDYVSCTPPDALTSSASVEQRLLLIRKNRTLSS